MATTAQTSPAFGRSYVVASPTDVFSLVGLGLSVDLRARLSRPLSPLASPGSGSATSWGSSLPSCRPAFWRGGRAPSMDEPRWRRHTPGRDYARSTSWVRHHLLPLA